MKDKIKVSVIVPVFNEEKTVSKVVTALLTSNQVDEVIVVNDGSIDKSLEKIKSFGKKIKLINLKKNMGKGYALAEGVGKALGEVVMFIDADIVNLKQKNIEQLLEPIINHHWRAVVGVRKNIRMIPSPFARLSGERVYYKEDLLEHLKQMRKTRFGIEIFLNHLFDNKPVKKISLMKLKGLYKYEKRDPATAFKEYVDEGVEIARELARQEKLLVEDLKIIERLKKATNFYEFKDRVEKISNLRVREYLEKYVLKYLQKAKSWWQKW